MPTILIVYYSHTGNTQKMAEAIAEGVQTTNEMKVEVKRYASAWDLKRFDAILIGAPTYHRTMNNSLQEFLDAITFHKVNLKGKIGATFGSYGWSGEAPRRVLDVMETKFGMKIIKPPLLIKYKPDEEGLEECRRLGTNIIEQLA